MDIARRVKKAEERLGVGKEPVVVGIVFFGDGPLPPDPPATGNVRIRHVRYADGFGNTEGMHRE
jgi:hypothetical protein